MRSLLALLLSIALFAPAPTTPVWAWPLPPTPVVLQAFDAPEQPWLAGHRGVDLAAQVGTVVLAPHDGVVSFAGNVAGRGVITIDVGNGLRTSLEPVAAPVPVGTLVRQGEPIALVAASDQSHCARSCLHWGVRAGPDDYLDPLALLGPRRYARLLPSATTRSATSP